MKIFKRTFSLICLFGLNSLCCGDNQLIRINNRLTWLEADTDCRSRNGQLLVLDSPEKVTAFEEQVVIEKGEQLWTAGYREHSPWVWIEGCFSSKNLERSKSHTIAENQASVCATVCHNDTYAALKGNKCYCFDDLREFPPLDARACNFKCAGSSTEVCGGRKAISVYSIGGVKGYKESITEENLTIHEESRKDWTNCVYILKHNTPMWLTTNCRKPLPFLCKIYREEGMIMEYTSPKDKIGTWTEANAMCREEGGTLADLHANDLKAVSALPKGSEFWVGLYRNTSWEWHTENTEENPRWCTVVSKDDIGKIHFKTMSCSLPHNYVCQTGSGKAETLVADESQIVVYAVCGTVAWALAIVTTVFIIYCMKRRGCRRRMTSEDNSRINSNYFDLDEEPVSRQNSHSYVNEANQASSSSKSARGMAASRQEDLKRVEQTKIGSCQATECSRYYSVNGNEYATVITGKTASDPHRGLEGACGNAASSPRSSTSTDSDYDHVWDSLGKLGKKPVANGAVRHYENSSKAVGNEQRVKLPEKKENDYETFPIRDSLKPCEEIVLADKRQLARMRSNSM